MSSPLRLRVLLGLALAVAPVGAFVLMPACASRAVADCPGVYDPNRIGPNGEHDPCCEQDYPNGCPPPKQKDGGADAAADASDAGPPSDAGLCNGTCVPLTPAGWWGPLLFTLAPSGSAPSCPPGTTSAGLEQYHADLDAGGPIPCGACSCAPADGECGPPTSITASEGSCQDGGAGWTHPFDGPPAWDGGCTATDAIPPGNAQSVLVEPLTVTGNCAPQTADAGTAAPPSFGSDVVACWPETPMPCDPAHVCAPTASPFHVCIYTTSDMDCPPAWPERQSVAQGFDDARGCSPCTCGAVEGASCTGTLSIASDSSCTSLQVLAPINSTQSKCFDVTAGTALGSKAITGLKYVPGTCTPSGGEPEGEVTPAGLATFCCRPGDAP